MRNREKRLESGSTEKNAQKLGFSWMWLRSQQRLQGREAPAMARFFQVNGVERVDEKEEEKKDTGCS